LNTLKHEYPKFGGKYQVFHGVEFLVDLVSQKKPLLSLSNAYGKLTYHDSCYLGRYNHVYNQPRDLLKTAQITPLEMRACKENSFCCGGGGGAMWLETSADTRINQGRLQQALDIQADTVATSCPYCLIMFDDALRSKGLTDRIQVLDVVEILNQGI
jgi:Fe-S oxidoreductase